MITEQDYARNVQARASTEFHDNMMPLSGVIWLIQRCMDTSNTFDAAKKTLFYGKYPDNAVGTSFEEWCELFVGAPWPKLADKDRDLLHALMGITSELSEAWAAFGKRMNELTYTQGLQSVDRSDGGFDHVNMLEELGDILWYLQLGFNSLDTSMSVEMERNDKKLEARYGPAFSADRANTRDLAREREVLEGSGGLDDATETSL